MNGTPGKDAVAVIGGGFAGCAVSLSLLQHTQVEIHLFTEERPSGLRVGESVPPAFNNAMSQLGVEDLVRQAGIHIPCPGSQSIWNQARPGCNEFLLMGAGDGWHLDRVALGNALLDRVQKAGVEVHLSRRLSGVNPVRGGLELNFSDGYSCLPGFVIDATGKAAHLARRLGIARNSFDHVIALTAIIPLPEQQRVTRSTLTEACPYGWWYACQIPNRRLLVSLYTDEYGLPHWRDRRAWWQALQGTRLIWPQVPADAIVPDSLQLDAAPSSILSRVVGPEWLAVGDAASAYDPITSSGITRALLDGYSAGAAVAAHLAGDQQALESYQAEIFRQFNRYAALRYQLYASEQRFPDSAFWRARVGLEREAEAAS